ncbi:pyrroline-5-carboxylate reductase [Yimella lutea]|uniref:Pyrroline-5-carboxylate reductase n=1 Tax=Yimella lutea TaxID=587872 RepID=A0A542EDL9_9MICO|nr:pyrroline-5-carboxylate reductase [Yimella lutea]TQJ13422.1 pyrroline-5-carboxylate reductase [Yimella lutea]
MSESSAPAGTPRRLAVLGVGVMGEALLAGLLRSGQPADHVVVGDRYEARAHQIVATHGVRAASPADAVVGADTVVLAVKPQDMSALLDEIRDRLEPGALVVSIAAGIATAYLEARLPEGTPVARAMPNTPALVDQGMAAVSPGTHCGADDLAEATRLLEGCGKVVTVAEHHMDAITAISGSGPAYLFYVVEAMIEAGVLLGLPRNTSTELVVQTVVGAATMLKETGEHPTVLREQVSSPGGTTMAALRQLDDHKVRAAFLTAMEAAAHRSAELAQG